MNGKHIHDRMAAMNWDIEIQNVEQWPYSRRQWIHRPLGIILAVSLLSLYARVTHSLKVISLRCLPCVSNSYEQIYAINKLQVWRLSLRIYGSKDVPM